MLDEDEWQQILPELRDDISQIQESRQDHGSSPTEPRRHVSGEGALERYYAITGFRETNVYALWHHRLILFGPPCQSCGKPLRTRRAKLCAACGASRD